jgi:hypothetical protein
MENKYSQDDAKYFINKMKYEQEKKIKIIMAIKILESKIFAEVEYPNATTRTEQYLKAFNELNRKLLLIINS